MASLTKCDNYLTWPDGPRGPAVQEPGSALRVGDAADARGLYVYLSIYLAIYLSIYIAIYISIYLSLALSLYIYIYIYIYIHIHMHVCTEISLSIYLYLSLSFSLSLSLSIYIYRYMYIHTRMYTSIQRPSRAGTAARPGPPRPHGEPREKKGGMKKGMRCQVPFNYVYVCFVCVFPLLSFPPFSFPRASTLATSSAFWLPVVTLFLVVLLALYNSIP